ncbi:MAG: chemotaxis protein CheA [Armatimonadetes bacterium]|nr:chemotaxis protein CheA [Armatimonadota bacterium]
MSNDLDMSQYLDLFLQEAEEQLSILEQETVKLESDPTTDRLNLIFRAAHTLKGSSRAMGFLNFGDVTHEMENVLDLLRSGQLTVDREVADALLQSLDALMAIRDQIAEGQGDAYDAAELTARLERIAKGGSAAPAASVEAPKAATTEMARPALESEVEEALKATIAAGAKVYETTIVLTEECLMKYVRVFMTLNAVQEQGEVLHTVPGHEALEDESFERQFTLYFQSTEAEADLLRKLRGIGDVQSLHFAPWSPAEASAPQPEAPAAEDKAPASPTAAAKPEVAAPAAPTTPAKKAETNQTVRVDVARLDSLMNLVGELVIDRTRISQIGAQLAAKYEMDENIEALAESVGHIHRITSDLQDEIMKARMLPIETVFARFPRMIRDLASKLNKQVKLEMKGGETELDRSVIEVIGDPLIHILRNSVDHGIESPERRLEAGKPAEGTVHLSARHEENHIVIEIQDDGGGIDVQRIKAKAIKQNLITAEAADRMSDKDILQFIFHGGFSTAEVVSDVSGRGVGMDIVRSNLQNLGGLIDLDTVLGHGTKFTLRLPLTLAIIRGLLVKVAGVVFVIPLGSVVETLHLASSEIKSIVSKEVVLIRGVTTPIIRLRDRLRMSGSCDQQAEDSCYVVVVGLAEKRAGLVVDSLVGEQEVVIKSLSRYCGEGAGVSGATILGNGSVALITDVNSLFGLDHQGDI